MTVKPYRKEIHDVFESEIKIENDTVSALWDCGADWCAVSEKLNNKYNFTKIGSVKVFAGVSEHFVDVAKVCFTIYDKKGKPKTIITAAKIMPLGRFDFLIGMNVIKYGSLKIKNNKMTFKLNKKKQLDLF